MLETTDILNLENRWKKYRFKKILKKFSIILSIPLVLATIVYLYMNDYIKLDQLSKSHKQVKVKNEQINTPTIEKNIVVNKNEHPMLTLQPITTKNNLMQPKQPQKVSEKNSIVEVPLSIEKQEEKRNIENKSEKNSNEVTEKKERIVVEEHKSKVLIETEKIETVEYLKNKFYDTNNIVFALMLAEEYLHKKDYKNSIKWALRANELDPQSERSWIVFAKAKAKNGNPNQAIKALQAFQKISPSPAITTLIDKIKHGEY